MTNRVAEACARQLEMLFANPVLIPNTGMAERPIVGGPYIVDFEDHSQFFPMIIAALVAREQFRQDAPGAPILPLRREDIELFKNDDCPRLQVVGLYGDSWRYAQWDPQHPRLGAFISGLMFYDHTPDAIRDDLGLRREFPPQRLDGLADGWLVWRSPEKLAFDRERRVAQERMGLIGPT